jgi:myosin-5
MNALLEPFGNAHVEANANSSRFGKLVELQFVRDGLEVAGSRIRHYLLEKVCVTE